MTELASKHPDMSTKLSLLIGEPESLETTVPRAANALRHYLSFVVDEPEIEVASLGPGFLEKVSSPRHSAMEVATNQLGDLIVWQPSSPRFRDVDRRAAPLERFFSKATAVLDDRQMVELSTALEQALDDASATASHPALADLEIEPLTLTEQLSATTGGIVRRLEFEREQFAVSEGPGDVARRLRTSQRRVEELREGGRLVALEAPEGEWRYPRWQFASETSKRPLRGLRPVLRQLQVIPPLARVAWLTSPKPTLGGRSPLDALRAGDRRDVKLLARAVRGLAG